jgi:hypothetical protein
VPLRHGHEAFIEILEHETIFHSMVWVLEPFPCLGDGLE